MAMAAHQGRDADGLPGWRTLAHMVDGLPVSVIVTDREGIVRRWLGAAQSIFGWSADEVLGRRLAQAAVDPLHAAEAQAIVAAVTAGACWLGRFTVRVADASLVELHVLDIPLTGADGGVIGMLGLSLPVAQPLPPDGRSWPTVLTDLGTRIAGGALPPVVMATVAPGTELVDTPTETLMLLQAAVANTGLALATYGPDGREIRSLAGEAGAASIFARAVLSESGTRGALFPLFTEALRSGRSQDLVPVEGRTFSVTMIPIRGADGDIHEVVAVALDVTESERSAARHKAIIENVSDIISIVDAQANLLFSSPSMTRTFGSMEGRGGWDFVHPDDVAATDEAVRQALSYPGASAHVRFRGRHADGSWRLCDTIIANRFDEPALRGLVATSRDVTEIELGRRARQQQAWLEAIVDSALDAVVAVDSAGSVTEWSRRAEKVFGWPREEMLGRPLAESLMVSRDAAHFAGAVRELVHGEAGQGEGRLFEVEVRRRDGAVVPVELALSVLRPDGGDAVVIGFMRDLTEARVVRSLLDRTHADTLARIELILRHLPVSLVATDAAGVCTEVSGAAALLGDAGPGSQLRSRWAGQRQGELLERALGGTAVDGLCAVEGRIFDIHMRPVRDGSQVVTVLVVALDVTDRKQAESERSAKATLAASVLDSLPDHTAVVDRDGTIIAVNSAWQRFAQGNGGTAAATEVGVNYLAACDQAPDDPYAMEMASGLREVLAGNRSDFSLQYPCDSGGDEWYVVRVAPMIGGSGAVISHLDITKRRAMERQLTFHGLHDGLTGLPNRTLLVDRLGQAMSGAVGPTARPFVLVVGVDALTSVNETLGHRTGDMVIMELAQRLLGLAGTPVTVARLGGDEFAVLVPAPDETDPLQLADEILAIVRTPLDVGGGVLVTATVGIAEAHRGDDPHDVLVNAAAALYRGRERGTDRVELFA